MWHGYHDVCSYTQVVSMVSTHLSVSVSVLATCLSTFSNNLYFTKRYPSTVQTAERLKSKNPQSMRGIRKVPI